MNKELQTKIQETMRGLRFGVEIEYTGISRKAAAQAVGAVVGDPAPHPDGRDWVAQAPDGRRWKVTYDGSVAGSPSDRGGELVTPILNWADLETLQAVVRALRAAGARADESCGIHVHVDGAKFKSAPKSLRTLAKLVFSREEILTRALGVHGTRRQAVYCKPLAKGLVDRLTRCSTDTTLSRAWYDNSYRSPRDHYHETRYHGLNLHSYWYRGTIEFRYFDGSVHAGEVKAYVHFCLAMASRALNTSAVGKRKEIASFRPSESLLSNMRWFLNEQLGLTDDEYKTTRRHLTKRLPGAPIRSSADRAEPAEAAPAPAPLPEPPFSETNISTATVFEVMADPSYHSFGSGQRVRWSGRNFDGEGATVFNALSTDPHGIRQQWLLPRHVRRVEEVANA